VWAGGAAVGVATIVVTAGWLGVVHPDLVLGRWAAATLLSPQWLDTYVRNPLAQMGPLAIALARLPTRVYYVGVAALVAVVGPLLALSRPRAVRAVPAVLTATVWGVAVPVPWSQLAWKGHADDALVLLGVAVLLAARARGSAVGQLCGLVLGLLGKPTAVVLVFALLPSPPAFALGLALAALIWGPFVLHDPAAMLKAGKGVLLVVRGSLPDWLGVPVRSKPPGWVRLVQSAAGALAVLASLARDRVAEGILLAFAVRALVEPNPAPAYVIPLVVLALVPDLTLGLPIFTSVSIVAFHQSQATLNGAASWPRLVSLAVLVALAVVSIALPHDLRPRFLTRSRPAVAGRDVPAVVARPT